MLKRKYMCSYGDIVDGVFSIENGLYFERSYTDHRYTKNIKILVSEYIPDLIRVEEYNHKEYSCLIFNSYICKNDNNPKFKALKLETSDPFVISIPWVLSLSDDTDISLISKIVCTHYKSSHAVNDYNLFSYFIMQQLKDKIKCENIYLKDVQLTSDFSIQYECAMNLIQSIENLDLRKLLAPNRNEYMNSCTYPGFINRTIDGRIYDVYIDLIEIFNTIGIPDIIKNKGYTLKMYKSKIYNVLYTLGLVTPSPFCQTFKKIKSDNCDKKYDLGYIRYTTPIMGSNNVRHDMLRVNMRRMQYYFDNSSILLYREFAISALHYFLQKYHKIFYCKGLELIDGGSSKGNLLYNRLPMFIYIDIRKIMDRVKKDALYKHIDCSIDIQIMKVKNYIIFNLVRELYRFHYYDKHSSLYVKAVINNLTLEFIRKNFTEILNDIYQSFCLMPDILDTLAKYNQYIAIRKLKFLKASLEYIYADTLYSLYREYEPFKTYSIDDFRSMIRLSKRAKVIINSNECAFYNNQRYLGYEDFMNFIKVNKEFYEFLMTSVCMKDVYSADVYFELLSGSICFKIYKK